MRARGANAVYLPDIRFPAESVASPTIWPRRSRHRVHRVRRAVARHARDSQARGAARASRRDGRQRDKGPRAGHAVAHVGDHRAGAWRRRACRRALGSRASRRSWRASCRPRSRSRRAIAQVVKRVQAEFRAPYLRLYGTDDVVGVEIGGALKNIIAIAAGVVEGLGPGAQRAGRSHHARPGGDVAPGLRRGRQARDAGGPDRPRRPRADVHGRAEPQPSRRHRAGAAAARWPTCWRG